MNKIIDIGGENDIVETLAFHFGLDRETIIGSTRLQKIVKVRDLIVYLLREYGDLSFPSIGRLIGGRDHTTIMHAYKKIKRDIVARPDLETELRDLIQHLDKMKQRKGQIENDLKQEILSLSNAVKYDRAPKIIARKIQPRNAKILDLYREGLTLENIGKVYDVSRERVRQIVLSTLKQLAINESIHNGVVMDTGAMLEEESKRRKKIQTLKRVNEKPKPVAKEKRWSRYYLECQSCGTTTYPHVRNGLCEQCMGNFRKDRREQIIQGSGGVCESCGRTRSEAAALYGRDFYITNAKKVLCRGCFLKNSGSKLGSYKRFDWSRNFPRCVSCGTTTVPYVLKGLCENCAGILNHEMRERRIVEHGGKCDRCGIVRAESIEKYKSDFFLTKSKGVFCRKCFLARNMESVKKAKK